jgi:hypothetical protein
MGPSMAPIRLTDSQLDAVLAEARPLAAGNRDAFLQAIVDALEGVVDPGDGDIHRAIMTAQRRFWDPPLMDHLAQHRGPLVVTLESPIEGVPARTLKVEEPDNHGGVRVIKISNPRVRSDRQVCNIRSSRPCIRRGF